MGEINLRLSQFHLFRNNTINYSDEEIIHGILNDSNQILEYLYNKYYSKVKGMVINFKNTVLIPDDIFQEGITRVILNIKNGKFRGDSSFYTYLIGICRNICLKELSGKVYSPIEIDMIQEDNSETFELFHNLLNLLNALNDKCKTVINLRFNLISEFTTEENMNKCLPFEDIAEYMSITPSNARQIFKRCFDKLRELVASDPEFKAY